MSSGDVQGAERAPDDDADDGSSRAPASTPPAPRRVAPLFLAALVAGGILLLACCLLLVTQVSGYVHLYVNQVGERVEIDCGSVQSPMTDFGDWAFQHGGPGGVLGPIALAERECAQARNDRRNVAVAVGAFAVLFLTAGVVSEYTRRRRGRHGSSEDDRSSNRRAAWAVGLAGALAVLVALATGFGFLAIGVAEATVVLVVLTRRRRTAQVRTWLGLTLAVLLLLGAYWSLVASTTELLPDPFGTNPVEAGSDLYCGSALDPGTDDHLGCAEWRDDRAVEAALFVILGLAAGTTHWVIDRHRSRSP